MNLDAIEAMTNATVGLAVSVLTVWVVWPLFGWSASLEQSMAVTGLFWALSAIRSYLLRRIFRRIGNG